MNQKLSVLFVDSDVDDYQILISEVKPNVEIFTINSSQDGVSQISEQLEALYSRQLYDNFDLEIHILSHGSPGCLYLGNSELNLSNLELHINEIQNWFTPCLHLSNRPYSSGLYLYGCNVAAGDAGEEFLAQLNHSTGANIYASTTKVGHPDAGGSWTLDSPGIERIQSLFGLTALNHWKHTLDPRDDTSSGLPNIVQNINIRENDINPNTSAATTIVTLPTNGTVALQPDGTVNYTPNNDFTGVDSFVYQIDSDYTVANPDRASITPGTTQTINVLLNDTDAQNEALTVTLPNGTTSDNGGTLVINANGTIDYTPAVGFLGLDSFTYQIDDGNGNTDTAIVELDIRFDEPRSEHYLPPRPAGSVHANFPMKLLITTELPTATGVISFPGSGDPDISFSITESTSDFSLTLGTTNRGGTTAFNTVGSNGIKVVTDNGEAINVQLVQENSNGQSFLSSKGLDALGTEFYAGEMDDINTAENNAPASIISVIATEDNTQVTFEAPNADTWNWAGTSSQTRTITLNEGQTFIIQPENNATSDITGARITSTKPIAVSSGNFGATLTSAVDNGWDQLVPVQRTGKDYVVVTGPSSHEQLEVIATKPNTQVFIDGALATTLANAGDVYTTTTPGANGTSHSVTTSENSYLFQSTGAVAGRGENGVSLIPAISPSGRSRVRFRTPADPGTINIILGADAVSSLQWVDAAASTPIDLTSQSGYAVKDVPGRTDVKVVSFDTTAAQSSKEYYFDSQSFIQVGLLAANSGGGGFAYISGFNFGTVQASDDYINTNTAIDINVLANDYDTNGNPLTIDVVGDPSNGTTAINPDNTITYTPNSGYIGPDSFTYSISDNEFNSAQAIVYINPDSPLPTATASITVSADTDGDGILDSFDIDDDNDGILDDEEGFASLFINPSLSSGTGSAQVGKNGTFANLTVSAANSGTITSAGADTFTLSEGVPDSTYTVSSDSPLYDLQLAIDGLVRDAGTNPEGNSFGNFQLTLSDGTVVSNATFIILNDVVAPNAQAGPFTLAANPQTLAEKVTIGGNEYVRSTGTSGTDQSFARIVFTDPAIGSLGITQISFEAGPGNAAASVLLHLYGDPNPDQDGDGVFNRLDLDSDNDGIGDLYESGTTAANIAADANNDGTIDDTEAAAANSGVADDDNDGLQDIFDTDTADTSVVASQGTTPVDSEATPDGTPDFLDLDSDNDTIPDTVEARPTAGYVTNDGDVSDNDSDGDGVIDQFDSNNTFGGDSVNFNAPVNSDSDTIPDYLDTDSDDDFASDISEAGPITTAPTYIDPDGSVNSPSADLANETGNTTEVAYREVPDSDGDGVLNSVDEDDDNDGILDRDENLDDEFVYANFTNLSGNEATGEINGIGFTYTTTQTSVASTTDVFGINNFPDEFNVPNNDPTIRNDNASTNQLTFDQPMLNPVLVFSSIGNPSTPVPIEFGAPVEVLFSQDTVINSPTRITGSEGYAIVRFNGLFDTIDFEYLADETYVNFVFGASFEQGTDSDSDGFFDHLDLDSDNDGITDNVEAQTTQDYIAPNADDAATYTANNGVNSAYLGGLTPADTDGDTTADVLDPDSDNDNTTDQAESGLTAATTTDDTDGDGLLDDYEGTNNNDGFDVNDENIDGSGNFTLLDTDNDTNADGSNASPPTTDLNYRDVNLNPVIDLNSDATSQGEIANPLVATGDALATPPSSAWEVLFYAGHFGVVGAAPIPPESEEVPQDGFGNDNGTPVLHAQSFLGQGQDTFSFSTDTGSGSGFPDTEDPVARAAAGNGITFVDNSTNGAYAPADYSNSGVWAYILRRQVTETTTITIGEAGDAFDDFGELFVNGVRVNAITAFTNNLPASSVLSATVNPGDVVEIRLSNRGGPGGFEVGFSNPGLIPNANFATTFNEGNSPVAVTDTDADVADFGDLDITALSITPGNIQDGSAESLIIVDDNSTTQTLELSQALATPFTVQFGGTTFDVNYDSTTITVTNNAGASTVIPQADLDALIRALSYENTSENPTVGDRTLSFNITDRQSATSPAAISTITVNGVNDQPVVDTPITDQTGDDSDVISLDISSNFSDIDSDTLTYTASGLPTGLSIDLNSGVISGTIDSSASQSGPFTVTVTASDGSLSVDDTFTWTVNNPAPVATNDGPITITEDTPVSGNVITDATADSDADSDTLSVTAATTDLNGDGNPDALTLGTASNITDAGSNPVGSIIISSTGAYTFTPAANYNGLVPAVEYTLSDADGATATATLSFDDIANVNDQPAVDTPITDQTGDDSDVISLDVSSNFSDIDGDTLTYTATGLPTGLSIDLNSGVISGTIDSSASQSGPFSVTVTANDGSLSVDDTLTWTVNNPAPVATNDGPITVTEDTPVSGNVITDATADSDADGDTLSVTAATIDLNGDGNPDALTLGTAANITDAGSNPVGSIIISSTGAYTFTPAANYNGPVPAVEYTLSDADGGTSTAALSFAPVTAVNDNPVVNPDGPITVIEDIPAVGNVLTNDSDVDGDTLNVTDFTIAGVPGGPFTAGTVATIPGIGTLQIAANGDFTFIPNANYNGPIPTAIYTATDGNGGSGTAELSFAPVTPVNDAVIANDDVKVVASNAGIVSINLTENDTDPDTSDDLEILSIDTASTQGTVTINSNNDSILYNPNGQFDNLAFGETATDTFTYTVTDGNGSTDTATVTVTIVGRNIFTGIGTRNPDFIQGTDGNDVINGFSDEDTLLGGAGNDTITGGSSKDTLDGGTGNDVLSGGTNDDFVTGASGNDTLLGGSGGDTLDGGQGSDTLTGNSGKDWLIGGLGADALIAGNDDDTLTGGAGTDTLIGGQGRDYFSFEAVSDFGDIIIDFAILEDVIDVSDMYRGLGSFSQNIRLIQSGNHAVIQAKTNGSFNTLGITLDVNVGTMDASNFKF